MKIRYKLGLGELKHFLLGGTIATFSLLFATACTTVVAPQAQVPAPLAPTVDAQKLGGQWFVIAHVPYAEERDEQDSSIELLPRVDGSFDEIYHYYDSKLMQSLARPRSRYVAVAGSNNARWVSHSRALDNDLNLAVFYVDPDYRFVVIGESQRRLGWIYARDPAIDAGTYRKLLAELGQRGYDLAQLHKLAQSQALGGKPQTAVP
jgi:apolipoprotein D and lipocalin family protein